MRFVTVNPSNRTNKRFFPATTNRRTAATCAPKSNTKNRPAVNIIETDDDYRIDLAAPGLGKEDFNLNVEDSVLTISAKKEVEKKEGVIYTRREFNYVEFAHSFSLSETIDLEQINAAFNNGILSVTLAKKEEAKPQPAKKIEVA